MARRETIVRKLRNAPGWFDAFRAAVPVLAVATLATSCQLEDPGPPYTVLAFEYDIDGAEYALGEVELDTLRSLRGLEGEMTRVEGGGDIGIDAFASLETEADVVDAVRVRGGRPVDPRWYVLDDVVVPEDFGTMLLFTFYAHMERCRSLFHENGLPPELPGSIPTFHLPTFGTLSIGGFQLIRDNAAYSPTFGAFALFPRQMLLDQLPLAMNLGVVCHEYGHAVFHSVVAPGSKVPAGAFSGWPTSAENIIRSVDEGLADLFGALATEDPDFIARSLPDDLDVDRCLEVERKLDDATVRSLDVELFYDPYPLGSVLASVLWRTRGDLGDAELMASGVRALYRISEVAGPDMDLATVTSALFEALEMGGRDAFCRAVDDADLPVPEGCENRD